VKAKQNKSRVSPSFLSGIEKELELLIENRVKRFSNNGSNRKTLV
jgi:hypothetical protein